MKPDLFELPGLEIQRFSLGPYETNCYLIRPVGGADGGTGGGVGGGKECWMIDASFGPTPMLAAIKAGDLELKGLIFTHAHIDHIAGAIQVIRAWPEASVEIHTQEEKWLLDPELNLSSFTGNPVTAPAATKLLQEGNVLKLGRTSWRVLHTPGHSPGSITLYCEEAGVAIVGDALFNGSIGRTDFPGCSFATLEKSIREKLYTLPPQTLVLCGHGPETTIGDERESNPFVRP